MDEQFGHFNLGPHTFDVSMSMHKENREKLLKLLQEKEVPANAVAIFEGGSAKTRHDTDHELLFRQESYFHYLFGVKEPDFYGLIDLTTHKSHLFIPKLDEAWAIFMGMVIAVPSKPDHPDSTT
jgi:Xaa-Pro dipeptidase